MSIYLSGGDILLDGGDIALAEACCCAEECVAFAYGCTDYFTASTRGVAGTQPDVDVTISSMANKSSNPSCSKNCDGCDEFFNATFSVSPCTDTGYSDDVIQCDNWGLLGGSAPVIKGVVLLYYDIEIHGTETVAFVRVQLYEGGAATCDADTTNWYNRWSQIYHLNVSNPNTWKYPASCGDDTKWTSFPGLLSGSFTSGLGGYTPTGFTWAFGSGGDQPDGAYPPSCDNSSLSVSVATA